MLLDRVPLWALSLAAAALVLVPVEIGYRVGRREHARPHEKERLGDVMVAPALGLLAFVLAFTFNVAQTRFDARREAALQRVNILTTAFDRAVLAPEPYQSEIRRLLRAEVAIGERVRDMASLEIAVEQLRILHDTLWRIAAAGGRIAAPAPMGALVVQAVSDLLDADARRVHGLVTGRIPTVMWLSIALLTALATGLLGYDIGLNGSRRSLGVVPLALAFAIVIFLIADLDRPVGGFLQANRESQRELQSLMRGR